MRCCLRKRQETSLAIHLLESRHCGTEDLSVLQTIFWSAGASRNALAKRLAYSKSKANAMVAALLHKGLLDEVDLRNPLAAAVLNPFDWLPLTTW
jgi:predicted transcriptional regulator